MELYESTLTRISKIILGEKKGNFRLLNSLLIPFVPSLKTKKPKQRGKTVAFVRQTGTPLLTNSDMVDNDLPALCLGFLMYEKRITIVLVMIMLFCELNEIMQVLDSVFLIYVLIFFLHFLIFLS